MKQYKNTYKQDKNFKDLQFSEGEFLTEDDLDIIESRTTTYNEFDDEFENGYWGEEYEDYTRINFLNKYEAASQYDVENSFNIGNNVSGGV